MNINDYGIAPNTQNLPGIPARVTAVHRERYEIVCEHGMTHARLKTKEYYVDTQDFPTTGDFVMINYIPNGDSQIIATLPRRTFFSRREPGPIPRDQAVAANFDYVFIMQSLNIDFNPKRLERYLTLAWQSDATPVILLTKADLVDDYWDYITQVERVAAGVNTHVVSAHTGYGLQRLNAYLQPGKTVVFLGSSGVGKSSLVNALAGEEIMTVNGIREDDSKGRHTTTHRQLITLQSGVMIIDTPGMRELGMWDVSEGLADAFAGFYKAFCREFGSTPSEFLKSCRAKRPYRIDITKEEHMTVTHKKAAQILKHWNLGSETITDIYYEGTGSKNDSACYVGEHFVLKYTANLGKLKNHIEVSKAIEGIGLLSADPVATADGQEYIQDGELYFYLTKRLDGQQMVSGSFYDGDAICNAIPYVILANQFVCVAWFAGQDKYAELFATNKRMTLWLIAQLEELKDI